MSNNVYALTRGVDMELNVIFIEFSAGPIEMGVAHKAINLSPSKINMETALESARFLA